MKKYLDIPINQGNRTPLKQTTPCAALMLIKILKGNRDQLFT